MNTYVTWEQAKLLKEKGFEVMVSAYFQDNGKEELIQNKYPANYNSIYSVGVTHSRPEQWQVVEWVLQKYNIWVTVQPNEPFTDDDWCFKIFKNNQLIIALEGYNTPQETYSGAFDYILKELI